MGWPSGLTMLAMSQQHEQLARDRCIAHTLKQLTSLLIIEHPFAVQTENTGLTNSSIIEFCPRHFQTENTTARTMSLSGNMQGAIEAQHELFTPHTQICVAHS